MYTREQKIAYDRAIGIGDEDKADYIKSHPARVKSSKGKNPSNRQPKKKKRN
jgi:hypothetical protein